jgi:hypothetical protein
VAGGGNTETGECHGRVKATRETDRVLIEHM